MSMKLVRNAIEKYNIEISLEILVLERQAQSSKPLLESDSQETSLDKGVSLVELELCRDQHSNVLSSSESEQAPLKNNSESSDDCARSDNEEATAFGTDKEIRKFFAGMGWYSSTFESYIEQSDGSNT